MIKILMIMKLLHDMGHSSYPDEMFPCELKCSTQIEEINQLVS